LYIEKIEQQGNTINIYIWISKKVQSSNTTVNITVQRYSSKKPATFKPIPIWNIHKCKGS